MTKGLGFVLILCTMILSGICCFAAPPSEDYVLCFADEFDGDALDARNWGYRGGTAYGGKNLSENVRVADGYLNLDYRKVDGVYTGAGIITNFTMRYGYYEVRAKVYSGANGLHTSFWTSGYGYDALTPKPAYYPQNNCFMEIDAFEVNSNETGEYPNIAQCLHYFTGDHVVGYSGGRNDFDCAEEWFVMGFEWLPDKINYYLNGELLGSAENLQTYNPAYMWLTAVATPERFLNADGTYNIDDSKMDENGYFGSSQFDYFRYYQIPFEQVNLLGNGNFEYNRAVNTSYPVMWELKGDTAAAKIRRTPLSHDGICHHVHQSTVAYDLSTGQEFNLLSPGKYTFKGNFKTSGIFSKARLAVYDKNGREIAEKRIVADDKWTEICLSDIEITDYAYVAIESASNGNTVLSMDSLEFYLQEGISFNGEFGTPRYAHYNGYDPIDGPVYQLTDAASVTGEFVKSGLDADTYYLKSWGTDRNIEVTWEVPVTDAAKYRLEWWNVPYEGNAAYQIYDVVLPDGTETEVVLDTSEDSFDGWVSLGSYDLAAGDVITVKLKDAAPAGHIRVTRLRINKEEKMTSYEAATILLNNCVFAYRNGPYMFDVKNEKLVPYMQNGVYYIPWQALKENCGFTADIAEDAVYITDNQLKEAGFGVTVSGDLILLHAADAYVNDNTLYMASETVNGYAGDLFTSATYQVGTDAVDGQIVLTRDDAVYTGNEWTASNHLMKNYYTSSNNCTASFGLTAPESGKYAVEIYSPAHTNSTSAAGITVYANQSLRKYVLDQRTNAGWYTLGVEELEEGDTVRIEMKRQGSGFMRVASVRLVPLYSEPVVTKDGTALTLDLGHAFNYVGTVILAEQTDGDTSYSFINPIEATVQATLQNENNSYRLFFWQNMTTFKPLYADK